MEQAAVMNDVTKFFKDKKELIAKTYSWWAPLRWRVLYFRGMQRKAFTFGEFCQLMFLTSRFDAKRRLQDRFYKFFDEEIKRESSAFYPDGTANLIGNKFRTAGNVPDLIDLIDQVLVHDQYHAKQFLKEDAIVIDAGANIGAFSVFAAHIAPKGRIYAFEPARKTFELLREDTANYPQVTCVPLGLGDTPTEKKIFVDEDRLGDSVFEDSPFLHNGQTIVVGMEKSGVPEMAKITTLDGFVSGNNLPRIDFIKIDTEGYEAMILRGAKETIKRWKPIIRNVGIS